MKESPHLRRMLWVILFSVSFSCYATQLSGVYTIDSSATASSTNFHSMTSAIIYMTSGGSRPDSGPSNSSPYGVSGPVVFNFTGSINTYQEQVTIPNIPGASDVNTIRFNGYGIARIQYAPVAGSPHVIKLDNARFVILDNMIIAITSSSFGWGVHFINNSDSNMVKGCIIDFSAVTSVTSPYGVGIAMTNSTTSATIAGNNGIGNRIINNQIIGIASAGPYYGITNCMSSNSIYSANKFINNTISNYYACGIYSINGNGTIISRNYLSRPLRSSSTTFYGIFNTSLNNDTITNNIVERLFDGILTSTLTGYAFYLDATGTTTSQTSLVANNIVRNINSTSQSGSFYGFYSSTPQYIQFYHNTVSFDYPSGSNRSYYGLYFGFAPLAGTEVINNIFSLSTPTGGAKYGLYLAYPTVTGLISNNNDVYVTSPGYFGYLGANYATLAQWQAAAGSVLDTASTDANPLFSEIATGNVVPKEADLKNKGANLFSVVPYDFTGAPRDTTPDIGAYEFALVNNDAATTMLSAPTVPFAPGTYPITVKLKNNGLNALTSATINWSVNGVAQTPFLYSGSLNTSIRSTAITLGSVTFTAGISVNIMVWSTVPNGVSDPNNANDTSYIYNLYSLLTPGTYTLNKNSSAAGNFASFNQLAGALNGGVSGPVTINVVPGSGPYTEQVAFPVIPGCTQVNNVVINGNNEILRYNNTNVTSLYLIKLNGTDNLTIKKLRIVPLNQTYGWGIWLTNQADTNTIDSCVFDYSNMTTTQVNSGGIVFSSSPTSTAAAGANGSWNTISNNQMFGGPSGGLYYCIALVPATSNSVLSANRIINNRFQDFYAYGIYMNSTWGTLIKGNDFSRPTKTTVTAFFGVYAFNSNKADTFDSNKFHTPFGANPTGTGTAYGINFAAPNFPSGNYTVIRNNLFYDFRTNGTIHGIYGVNFQNIYIVHNTFNFVMPNSPTIYCINWAFVAPSAPSYVYNNIFNINAGGTTNKFALYFGATGTNYFTNSNVFNISGTNAYIGYYSANYSTLSTWQTANTASYDLNSIQTDPRLISTTAPELMIPTEPSIKSIGNNMLTYCPVDILSNARDIAPDPGAYEFIPSYNDAGIPTLSSPTVPMPTGSSSIDIRLKNYGLSTLTSANINWSLNGITQTGTSFSGTLSRDSTATIALGTLTPTLGNIYKVKAWSSQPNGTTDTLPYNDSIVRYIGTAMNGIYTINPALPDSVRNFKTYDQAVQTLYAFGINAPVTFMVSNGIYNEQVSFTGVIPGSDATNTVTFIGADSANCRLVHDGIVRRATVLFNNAKNITFRNMSIECTGISGGYGVQFINSADSNVISKCRIRVPLLTSFISTFAPVVSSASLFASNSAGNNGSYLTIDSCTLTGGYYGVSLYNSLSLRGNNNRIRYCNIVQPYFYGLSLFYQNDVVITQNTINGAGNNLNSTVFGYYLNTCDSGFTLTKNTLAAVPGGYGIYYTKCNGTSSSPNIIANNMVQIGAATSTSFGIYDAGSNKYTDLVYNAVNNTSGDASYVSTALYFNYANATTSSNLRVNNNIFAAPNGALSVYCPNSTALSTSSITLNNNVYYSPSSYPFRIVGTIYPTLSSYASAMSTFITGSDSSSIFQNPAFFSATNLRTITPQLGNIGTPIPTVTDDIDGQTRSSSAPDPGVYEFTAPPNDAGAIAFVQPTQPLIPGLSDLKVVIQNFGTNTLSSAVVTYRIDTVVRSRTYSGSILPGGTDTVLFNATSGPGGSSQRYNFTGSLVSMKAWTSSPNSVTDIQPLNDTFATSICGGLSGTYTINPSGGGTNNFTSIAEAVNKLMCGGVYGPVAFNISTGTYTGQIDIPTVAGVSATNTVVFKSVSNNPADVIINSSTSSLSDNYTIRLRGVSYMTFQSLTLKNSSFSSCRVLSINKFPSSNINTSNLVVRNCIIEGSPSSPQGDDAFALIYATNGDNPTNLSFIRNRLIYGAYGIVIGGQNIVGQYSPGLTIDSNIFSLPIWVAIYMQNRLAPIIRYNTIDGSATTGTYGIYLTSVSQGTEVRGNIINMHSPTAGTYGLFVNYNNYYSEPGTGLFINNVINMTHSTTVQNGIYLINSSQATLLNNTVHCASSSTSNNALYISGNAAGTSPIVQSNSIQIINNLLYTQYGYAANYAGAFSAPAVTVSNNNLYYSGSVNRASVNSVNYFSVYSFRNSLYPGSDNRSLFTLPVFTSTNNLRPDITSPSAWAVNGRGQQSALVTNDVLQNSRSSAINTGAPDIGAYEFTPVSEPPASVFTGGIGLGNTQYMVDYGDTVAWVTWGTSGTLPDALSGKYYPGSLVANPSAYNVNPNKNYMDVKWNIQGTNGSSYSYGLGLKYWGTMVGKLTSQSNIRLAKLDSGATTWNYYPVTSTVDTVNRTITISSLSGFSNFTGTDLTNPLPVKLSSFDARLTGSDVLLKWQTASELNTSYFEIERSSDHANFENAGRVNGKGNSNTIVNYLFTDRDAVSLGATVLYYRLKQIDKDGAYQYFGPIAVNMNTEINDFSVIVYPVPFTSEVNLDIINPTSGKVNVVIRDMEGRIIFTKDIDTPKGFSKAKLEALNTVKDGIYFLNMSINGNTVIRKLVKTSN